MIFMEETVATETRNMEETLHGFSACEKNFFCRCARAVHKSTYQQLKKLCKQPKI